MPTKSERQRKMRTPDSSPSTNSSSGLPSARTLIKSLFAMCLAIEACSCPPHPSTPQSRAELIFCFTVCNVSLQRSSPFPYLFLSSEPCYSFTFSSTQRSSEHHYEPEDVRKKEANQKQIQDKGVNPGDPMCRAEQLNLRRREDLVPGGVRKSG